MASRTIGSTRSLVGIGMLLSGLMGACSSTAGSTSGWSTRLEPVPAGVTLSPPPPDDVYWVWITSAKVPARTSGGQLWDEVGGWPDPVATLKIDGVEAMATSAATDTITPKWAGPHGNLHIPDSSSVSVELADQDTLQSLPIGKARSGPPTAADMSEGRMVFELGNRAQLIVRVEPAHGLLGLGFDYETLAGTTMVKKVLSNSPASRAGIVVGDEIVALGERLFNDMKAREIRSALNTIGSVPKKLVVKHRGGTTETFEIVVGPIYPLFSEYGELD